eukprot:6788264-Alexandrium_andersonii.AAC.1
MVSKRPPASPAIVLRKQRKTEVAVGNIDDDTATRRGVWVVPCRAPPQGAPRLRRIAGWPAGPILLGR